MAKSIYCVHPGIAENRKWIATLKEKTGHSLEEWITRVKKQGPPDEKARREWLKSEHGLGTNAAWWIAERAKGKGSEDDNPEAYLKAAEKYVTGGFAKKDRITHLIPITSVAEIDDEVARWLQAAYDRDA